MGTNKLVWFSGMLLGSMCASGCSLPSAPDSEPDGGLGTPVDWVETCDGAKRRALPDDLNARGPYDVGAITVELPRYRLEVWYPAQPQSAEGVDPKVYDIRTALAPAEAEKVSDAVNPWQPCECADGLPIDAVSDPFPLVVFVHGTASFRTQTLELVTHLASRGYVVAAADHPGLYLADTLALVCGYEPTGSRDLEGDIALAIETMRFPTEELAFLQGRVDLERIALVGHSAGGSAVAAAAGLPGVRTVVPLAGGTRVSAPDVQSLFMAALEDSVVPASRSREAFDRSTGKRSYVSLEGSGHLAFSNLCDTRNVDGKNLLEIGEEAGLCGANFAGLLFDCDPSYRPPEEINPPFHAAVTAVIDEALSCRPTAWQEQMQAFESVAEVVDEMSTDMP